MNSQLGRDMRLSVAEGGLATAMGSLFSGVFLTGFVVSLGATRLQIGILFALPALCGVAQLGGSYLIERSHNARRLCLRTALLSRLFFLPVLLAPMLGGRLSAEGQVWWIVAFMTASNVLGALGGVAWLTWIRALIPARARVPFFGRRNLVNVALSFSVSLAGGFLVDFWGHGPESRLVGFAVVFALAMACGLVGWCLLARISDAGAPLAPNAAPAAAHPPVHLAAMFAAPMRDENFRRVTLFYTAWTLATNVAAPFIPVFLLQKLGLPFWYVIVLGTLSSLTGLLANNFWTRLAHRFGMKPAVWLATLGDAFFPLALVFVTPAWSWVLLPIHLSGMFNTPLAIGADSFLLKLAPDRNASSYMAVFRSFVGPATALAAVLGGWLAGAWTTLELGPWSLGGLQAVFLLSFVGRLASLGLLHGVTEPESQTVGYLGRVLHRSWRRSARPAQVLPAPLVAPAAEPVVLTLQFSSSSQPEA